jgi:predicted O-methyltransferase YrrM
VSYLCALAFVAAIVFAVLWRQYRRRLYQHLGRDLPLPIQTIQLDDFDPLFAHDERGPTPAAEVVFIGRGRGVVGGTSDNEAWVLGVLARRARFIFEFGTGTGRSTYLMARNSPADARVVTIALPPDQLAAYTAETGDSRGGRREALAESRFSVFLYTGSSVEHKVEQLFGDTKRFDPAPYRGRCDLIFIDGSHTYSYVMSDTRKALEMLAPGGTILWHDYRGPGGKTADVFRALNELRRELPLRRLAGTAIVAYRSQPWRG